VRQSDNADPQWPRRPRFEIFPTPCRRGTVFQGDAVFFVETEIGEIGHDTNAGQAKAALHRRYARPQERFIAAKFIDHKAANASAIFGFEQLQGTQQGSEYAAAVDVTHQQAGRIRGVGHAHVDDIMLAQIDFGR
jgi:hypothetical protein